MKKRFTILLYIFYSANLFSQSNKLIDGFKDNSFYYSSFGEGSGTVSTSVSSSVYTEGSTSLIVNYTFNANTNSSFFTTMRNYQTNTQDYSFMPVSFSLDVYGGNSSDQLTIRLWEDVDMNGAFDNTDEVWICSVKQTLLGMNKWTTMTFKLSDFVLLAGTGNSKLDLNRIRAWDVAIYYIGPKPHTSSINIDNLKFNCSYTPPGDNGAKLTGVFIQLWNTAACMCGEWTQTQWETQMQKMKDVGISKVIIQYGVYNDLTWYSPSSLSFVVYKETTLNKVIAAAEKLNMKVMFGLYFDDTWNAADKASASTYSTILQKHKAVIDEMYPLFGSSAAFEGWYIPQEINDLEWQVANKKTLLFQFIQDVAAYAHTKDANKTVMISPFFNLWQPADLVGVWYNDMFTVATDLDLVYPQDGVGMTLKDIDVDIPNYFTQIKSACDTHGVGFGCNMESYHQLTGWPIDNGNFFSTSASIDVFVSQLQEAKRYDPLDIITFEWSFMQPDLNTASDKLYTDYSNYQSLITNTTDITKTDKTIEIYPNPTMEMLNVKCLMFNEKTNTNNIIITNAIGQIVFHSPFTIHNSPFTIDISSLSQGIYILHATIGEKIFNERFVKK